MKTLIVEDEKLAQNTLRKALERNFPDLEIVAIRESVKGTLEWLRTPGNNVDLIFMDVELKDGNCFEIFKQENITATEEEYEAELQKMADQYHIDLDRVREIMEAEKETMMTDLAVQKAVTFITDNAVEVEPKAEEAEESAEEAPAEAAEE